MKRLSLPFPPSVNTIWRAFRNRTILSKTGRQYFADVVPLLEEQWQGQPLEKELQLQMVAYYPDARKRDLDNCLKVTQDSLVKAGIILDDSQIVAIIATKGGIDREAPRVEVSLTEF